MSNFSTCNAVYNGTLGTTTTTGGAIAASDWYNTGTHTHNGYYHQYTPLMPQITPYQFVTSITIPRESEVPMKGNGKEFVLFKKGSSIPVRVVESEQEALDEAKELADNDGETVLIYQAVKKVKPVRRDVEVENL